MKITWRPICAGVSSILAGTSSFVGVTFLFLIVGLGDTLGIYWSWLIAVTTLIPVFLGVVSITGGYFALRRRIWSLALAGAVCALMTPLVFVLMRTTVALVVVLFWVSAIMGIIATTCIALAKKEFETIKT